MNNLFSVTIIAHFANILFLAAINSFDLVIGKTLLINSLYKIKTFLLR